MSLAVSKKHIWSAQIIKNYRRRVRFLKVVQNRGEESSFFLGNKVDKQGSQSHAINIINMQTQTQLYQNQNSFFDHVLGQILEQPNQLSLLECSIDFLSEQFQEEKHSKLSDLTLIWAALENPISHQLSAEPIDSQPQETIQNQLSRVTSSRQIQEAQVSEYFVGRWALNRKMKDVRIGQGKKRNCKGVTKTKRISDHRK